MSSEISKIEIIDKIGESLVVIRLIIGEVSNGLEVTTSTKQGLWRIQSIGFVSSSAWKEGLRAIKLISIARNKIILEKGMILFSKEKNYCELCDGTVFP